MRTFRPSHLQLLIQGCQLPSLLRTHQGGHPVLLVEGIIRIVTLFQFQQKVPLDKLSNQPLRRQEPCCTNFSPGRAVILLEPL